MDNSIVRGAIKGMIKDSEAIDKLVELLDCDRVDVGLQVASLKDKNGAIATIEEINIVLDAVHNAESSIDDAKYNAEETSDQANYCKDSCESANEYLYDVTSITDTWRRKIKDIKDAETMLDAVEKKKEEEQKEIDDSNEYEKKAPAKLAPAKKLNTDN